MENNKDKVLNINNSRYMVIDQTDYNNNTYLFVSELSPNDEPMMNFLILNAVKENDELQVSVEEDMDILAYLTTYFKKSLLK